MRNGEQHDGIVRPGQLFEVDVETIELDVLAEGGGDESRGGGADLAEHDVGG